MHRLCVKTSAPKHAVFGVELVGDAHICQALKHHFFLLDINISQARLMKRAVIVI